MAFGQSSGLNMTGPFYATSSSVSGCTGVSHKAMSYREYFDASRDVDTSTENRPRNIAFLPLIAY